jgi:Tfp pilus assembly protein PilN
MAQDINLLPEQSGEDKQQLKQRKLIAQVSVVVLGITIISVIALFAGKLFMQARIDGLDKEITTQDQRIAAMKNEEGIYRSLDAKLTSLTTFFSTQKHFTTFLREFSKTVPDSMKVTDMNVTADNAATITGKVGTYADLAGFYEKLRQAGPSTSSGAGQSASPSATPAAVRPSAPYFTQPVLMTISRDEQSGSITFTIKFGLSPQVIASAAS